MSKETKIIKQLGKKVIWCDEIIATVCPTVEEAEERFKKANLKGGEIVPGYLKLPTKAESKHKIDFTISCSDKDKSEYKIWVYRY